MAPDLKLSLLQQALIWLDPNANLRHFDSLLADIKGRDLIVLPETFATGFATEAAALAKPQPDIAAWMQRKAQQTQAAVAASMVWQVEGKPVNRFVLAQPDGQLQHYDKRHLFRMADEHLRYQAGSQRVIMTWRGWRILPLVCYDLRFPVWSRNRNDYDLALYVANWPQSRALHWQSLLQARAIENQAYVAGCNRIGSDGRGQQYRGDSQIISPQGEILAACPPHQAARLDADLSMAALMQYRQQFPAWQDADSFSLLPT